MIERLLDWWDLMQARTSLRWRPVRVVMTYRALRRRDREQRARGRLGYSRRAAWTLAKRS